ncbi:metal ABC transporter permease [Thaumasiovibrio subtropicus]|uniref:metal ABC transporter permease n=1 Tax=Thaumasiovibrio subtropicus TaxID=1891207 RepID=UPI000B351A76|nr:metal ABC transporter permease [Thaumasiovibrio subtropicus]
MFTTLIEPFQFEYMRNAILVSGLVGTLCALLSTFLILKGWSLIGDALSHAVVPGVAIAYSLNFPFMVGAVLTGGLAAIAMALLKQITALKQDAIIGLVFSSFFAAGLFIISLNPTSVSLNSVIFGNILAIATSDVVQIAIVMAVALVIMTLKWRDLMLVFFDEHQASAVGLNVRHYQWLFYVLLSASILAALQTVGAILVVAMVITPGATAYLLSDKFSHVLILSTLLGMVTCSLGAYISYFNDATTGAFIVLLQTSLFLLAFLFAPKHGLIRFQSLGTKARLQERRV